MSKQLDTVVFDLGNVLIDWDPRHLYRQVFDDEARVEQFLQDVCTNEWIRQSDAGKPMAECLADLIEEHPHEEKYIMMFQARWHDMMREGIPGTMRLLDQLKAQGTPLYVLSNWSSETWPRAVAQFSFLDLFDGLVVSGLESVAKPDPEIYRRLESHGVVLEQAVFIDDRPDNIRAANDLGMTGILYTDPESLATRLSELEILIQD